VPASAAEKRFKAPRVSGVSSFGRVVAADWFGRVSPDYAGSRHHPWVRVIMVGAALWGKEYG